MSKEGMQKLVIYKYQAEHIKDALRLVANTWDCHSKETCLDRDVMQSTEMITAVLEENPSKEIWKKRYEGQRPKQK